MVVSTIFYLNLVLLIEHLKKAPPGSQQGNADINEEFRPDNNRYLAVHECSGLDSVDAQSLQTIQDFISSRTDANRSVLERLHAIWWIRQFRHFYATNGGNYLGYVFPYLTPSRRG
jgi:hypothetical protein